MRIASGASAIYSFFGLREDIGAHASSANSNCNSTFRELSDKLQLARKEST